MIRVYLDNVIVSGRVVKDLRPNSEMLAVEKIERAHNEQRLKRVTSEEAWREQERTVDSSKRTAFFEARAEVSAMPSPAHMLPAIGKGPSSLSGVHIPLYIVVDDESLFDDLKAMGLKDADARHFRNAVWGKCTYFVTLDPDFFDRETQLQSRCPSIRILKPAQLVTDLGL